MALQAFSLQYQTASVVCPLMCEELLLHLLIRPQSPSHLPRDALSWPITPPHTTASHRALSTFSLLYNNPHFFPSLLYYSWSFMWICVCSFCLSYHTVIFYSHVHSYIDKASGPLYVTFYLLFHTHMLLLPPLYFISISPAASPLPFFPQTGG